MTFKQALAVIALSLPLVAAAPSHGACVDVVPQLVGDSSSVETSGTFSSQYPAWQAFDGATSTMWISEVFETPAWISYDFGGQHLVTHYSIMNTNGPVLVSRAPKDFEFQGWNGTDWVTIDTRSNETNWISGQARQYAVASPGLYSGYRLYILDDNDIRDGVVVISMGDLRFENCLMAQAQQQP